ncbi:MAG: (d)CMP kinase [Candidatus Bathyarchaeia archaeon]
MAGTTVRSLRKAERLVIAVSGLHGSGKSTQAKRLAETFGRRYFSAGIMFREMAEERGVSLLEFTRMAEEDEEIDKLVDERTRLEAEERGVVLDGVLSGWMAGDLADLKFFLLAPDEARFRRIGLRDGLSLEEARRSTVERDRRERERFKRLYNIDIDDLTIYDLVLNTELFDPDGTARILKKVVEEYLAER